MWRLAKPGLFIPIETTKPVTKQTITSLSWYNFPNMIHEYKHRVIYQDTDAGGVVYYANYLGFFERGRMELLRSLGVDFKFYKDKLGIVFAISRVECDYRSPARYDDEITIKTEIAEVAGVRIVFNQQVVLGDKILVEAKITAVALNLQEMKPLRLPKELLEMIIR